MNITNPRHEILFIDASVADAQSLIASISPNVEIVVLDDKTNVINQIAAALDGRQALDAIHIISHGAAGELAFANGSLNNANLTDYAPQLKRIGSALSANGDLLLYGCDVAKGETGLAFINQLSVLTGADVAASDDLTGNSFAGADWVLESTVGKVEADAVVTGDVAGFDGVLTAGIVITRLDSNPQPSLREAGAGAIALQSDGKIVVAGYSHPDFYSAFTTVRYNVNGSLDNSFNGDGIATTEILYGGNPNSVVIQPDGKILEAGGYRSDDGSYKPALVRYNSDGSLDTGFASNGMALPTGFSQSTTWNSVAIQTDGKILVAGYNNTDFCLMRYNTSGALDTSFDSDGMVTTDFGSYEEATSVTLQSDGKILVAGNAHLVRYNTNGSLDTSFDGDGKVENGLNFVSVVKVQADGKILVVGETFGNLDLSLVRYNSNGSLDTSFDGDGNVTTDITPGSWESAQSVVIQSDGKILVGGTSGGGTYAPLALVRYNSNGSLDTSFDGDGKASTVISDGGVNNVSIAVQTDGKIIMSATSHNLSGSPFSDIALVRFNSNGSLDTTFDPPVPPVQTPHTGTVTIPTTTQQYQTLTASNTLADANGLGTISYQWLSNGTAISGATQATYSLTQSDVGTPISVKASYTDGLGNLESETSNATTVANVNDLPTGLVIIGGTVKQNEILTADTSNVRDLDNLDSSGNTDNLGAISYQWSSNGIPISGATQTAYSLTQADAGKSISVRASYTDNFGTLESVVSNPTDPVPTPINHPPIGNILVNSAPPQQNQTLTVSQNTLVDADSIVRAINYQWLSNGVPISGKTQTTYTLTQTDVGKTLSVIANYTDGLGKLETVTSNSVVITNVNDLPTGSLTISGTLTQNQTLTATNNSIADLDGLGTLSYQWFGNDTAISGATATTYKLTQTEVGKTIKVVASYTDGFGAFESVNSNPTASVLNVNDPPTPTTGAITINGTVRQGETLTANSSLLADLDGLGAFSYQWLSSGGVISGQTESSYTLSKTDVGKTMSVKVSYTDGFGTFETVTSGSTSAVVPLPQIPPTGSVIINGAPPEQNQTLTATNTLNDDNGMGILSHQWLRDNVAITGKTQTTYTLTQADVNKIITVKVSYTDGLGKLESVTSNAPTIANVNDLPTGSLTISGTATQNQTLTATNNSIADLDGLGALSYQWFSNDIAISGATATTYKLTQTEVGKVIKVVASYTDGFGKLESVNSNPTAGVLNVNDPPTPATGAVIINGTVRQGETLTADSSLLADLDGLGTISYQWLSGGGVISGKTDSNYTLSKTDVGKTMSVKVSYIDGFGKAESVTSSSTSAVVSLPQIPPTGNVTINGTAEQNQTLTATNTLNDDNGLGTLSYQWLRDNVAISGKTQTTYTLTQADVNKVISVKASYTDGLGKLESATSNALTIANVDNSPTGSLTISGTATQNQTLTATNNSIADLDGLGTLSYQWFSNDIAIPGATATTYKLTQAEVSKVIKVVASYTDGFGKLESVNSNTTAAVVNVNDLPTGAVTISGTVRQGEILTADTSTLRDLDGLGTISYQWLRNGTAISDATQNTYTLTATDISKTISVKVSYIDGFSKAESVTSSSTVPVSVYQEPPTGSVTINGIPEQNQILTVTNNLKDTHGIAGAVNYQWLSDGVTITGETQSTYTLSQKDVGKSISVTANYTDSLGQFENVPSDARIIANVNDRPKGMVTITGETQVGQELFVKNNITDDDGMGTIAYQWQANNEDLGTGDHITLTKNEKGKAIHVIANYTDNFRTKESVQSLDTQAVTALNHKPTGGVFIEGDPIIGGILSVENDLKDDDGLGTMSYQWLVDDRKLASGESFEINKEQLGKKVKVIATYTDGEGNIESVDSPSTPEITSENHPPSGNLIIQGALKVGTMLSVTNTLDDADGLGIFKYKWLANGIVVKNATQNTYKLTTSEVGKNISVNVSYIDGLDTPESKTSSETAAIQASITINGITKKGDSGNNKLIGADKNDDLSGLAGADTLLGYAGNDLLDGGVGNDSLDGGTGNDELYASDGNDKLLGGSGNDLLDAGKGNDTIVGDLGNDTLNGGAGIDNMTGGDGNDYYYVDNVKDGVIETNKNAKTGGNDTIESTSNYVLGVNIENLVLTDAQGKGNSGTGNATNNTITGRIGDNFLKGMAGNDKLIGGKGADTLDGGLGMDTLIGGDDDDTYYMNNLQDKIVETKTGGEKDEVISTVSFELSTSPNVEMLTLSGAKAISGTGDEFNNLLQEIDGGKIANEFDGGAGEDTINGEGGNDTLTGGEGNDVLDGGDGNDVAIFSAAQADYQITRNEDATQFVVSYQGNDEAIKDGEDILTNVELLEFADGNGTYTIADLILNGVIS